MILRHWIFALELVLWSTPTPQCLQLGEGQPDTSSLGSPPRIATIIAMDIRLPNHAKERSKALANLNRRMNGTDVFICTDKAFESVLGNFSNVKGVRFAEDDGGFTGLAQRASHMRQWWRLEQCWRLVRRYEERTGQRYSFYFKLRTDCKHDSCPNSMEAFKGITTAFAQDFDKFAFLNSDRSFGAAPPVMERIATLYSRLESDYWERDSQYFPIDYNLVMRCDWASSRLHWLPFPKEAMQDACFTSENQLVPMRGQAMASIKECVNDHMPQIKEVTDKLRNLNAITARQSTEAVTGLVAPRPLAKHCSSERVIVLDLLLAGIEIHSYIG